METLEYESSKPHYLPTPEDRAWRWRRLGYYFAHVALAAIVVFTIGPNLILFHSPVSPRPSDYASMTNDLVPMIAAIKGYQRDTGSLPFASAELPKEYWPVNYRGPDGEILNTTSITLPVGRAVFEYEFAPGKEGWIVHAPRYDGPIPAPIVQAAASPTTNPSTSPSNHGNQ